MCKGLLVLVTRLLPFFECREMLLTECKRERAIVKPSCMMGYCQSFGCICSSMNLSFQRAGCA